MLLKRRANSILLFIIAFAVAATQAKKKEFHISTTRNVGYPQDKLPVPINACLNRIAVPGSEVTIYHGAAVEPTIAVNPSNPCNLVASWQQDRITNGGSLEAGIAYSYDGGKTWRRTEVPFQRCTGGTFQRATDVWLSFAADGSRVYLCAYVFNLTAEPNTTKQEAIVVSTSTNGGKTWSVPTVLASSQSTVDQPQFPTDDKNSITADPNLKRNAYAVWDRFPSLKSFHSNTLISRTTNGGATWSKFALLYNPFNDLCTTGLSNCNRNNCQTINNVVVVLPKAQPGSKQWSSDHWDDATKSKRLSGDLLNFMVRVYATPNATNKDFTQDGWPARFSRVDTALVRSQDQGVTWDTAATVVVPSPRPNRAIPHVFTGGYTYTTAPATGHNHVAGGVGTLLRTGDIIPSYGVNPTNGFLYTVFMTSTLRKDALPQIGITTSRDGGYTWSSAVRVNRTPQNTANPQAFTPFVAITPDGYVGILYNDFRYDTKANPQQTKTDAWFALYREVPDKKGGSTGIGLDFVKEFRLSPESYIAQNGPTTTQGVMTNGDYSFACAHNNKFYVIYTKSHKGPFKQPFLLFENPQKQEKVFVDDNYRQSPYVSVIIGCTK